MNPLDLPGPAFLAFYMVACAFVLGMYWIARRLLEAGPSPDLQYADPYAIAYLRAGAPEALAVSVVALADRGLIHVDGERGAAVPGAVERVRRPLERRLLEALAGPRSLRELQDDRALLQQADVLGAELQDQGLIVGSRNYFTRALLGAFALFAVDALALAKISVALARGHRNIGFLVMLSLGATFLVLKLTWQRRTARGENYLRELREWFGTLQGRIASLPAGGSSQALALCAGVFGMAALEGGVHAHFATLFAPPQRSGSWGNSSGGSCSSSCSSSCGGGCGGGGCGGCS